MAGVVAMASVIEDFDTQPCKKSRKDGGSPVVKTITNYFSPVAKPADKPFSPPRSNNIMDYFTRRPPTSKEKTSPSEQSKENCQTSPSAEKLTPPVRRPPQRRGRKTIKAARKLVESVTVAAEEEEEEEEESCVIVDEPPKGSVTEGGTGTRGVLGSDTAALLAQISAETCILAEEAEKSPTVAEQDEEGKPRRGLGAKPKAEVDVPVREKTKRLKTAAQMSKKRHQDEEKQPEPEPEEKEAETSVCDETMEVKVTQASETVTISFEDFLRSQDDGELPQGEGSVVATDAEDLDDGQKKSVDSAEPSVQVSPRTVTIQAEVHAVSPKQEAVKSAGKMASIFSSRKRAASPAEAGSSPQTEPKNPSPSASATIKRKSNVVLQEEDLELSVLESEIAPKCSNAERKQFMAAFKQPGVDPSRAKPGKSQAKQKGEKNPEPADDVAEEDVVVVEQVPADPKETNAAKKKSTNKGRKKTKDGTKTADTAIADAAATVPPPAEEAEVTGAEPPDKSEEPDVPAVRRSRREAVVRQTPDATATVPARKARKETKDGDGEVPATPKTRRSKHGVFAAEMVGPPDTKESPIRIKFTRVHRNVPASEAEGGSGTNSPITKTPDGASKKRKQAKKLVEKAKVMQQSKKAAAAAEEKSDTRRRSSRQEASVKRSYCENEDSIICLEDDQPATPPPPPPPTAPGKSKSQKPVRSLNDVLGKATKGAKVAAPGSEKNPRKAPVVISIFDDSSREGSDNSQDDEQFRARREFLKSGLPESFRKQIAKTAATKEAYSVSCSAFQAVAHVTQPPDDCPLWTLPWPESSLLRSLRDLWSRSSSLTPVSGSLCLKIEPVRRDVDKKGSGWRAEISDEVRQLLVEEVRNSNPSFPVETVMGRFLKRRADHQQQQQQQQQSCSTASDKAQVVSGKRKRPDDEEEKAAKVTKKQRSNRSEEDVAKSEPGAAKRGRTRRSQRSNPDAAMEENKSCDISAADLSLDDSVIVLDDLSVTLDTEGKDVVKEDVLWTEKYQPQNSSDIVGNGVSVRRLHSWLKEWKLRADREERKKQKEKKPEDDSIDSDWDGGEDDSQDAEDTLCNTMLITGPTGTGKTAAVYACAQELGFKVFEVNASSQRSGRLILSQLREATQSHQVDSQGVNAHKPTYFNSYATSSSSSSALRPGSSPRKVNSPRRVVSSPRKHPQSPRGAKRGSLAPTSLANFFKMGRPTNKEPLNAKKNEQAAATKKTNNAFVKKEKDPAVKPNATPKESGDEQSKKTATSLILFEEVDVIFEEDSGFLAAIKTFMTTTKRPVVLTTSDPAFSAMFDGYFEEITFKTPSVVNVGAYLQLLCLSEDVRTERRDIDSLLRLNGCDVRQSLLQLQFWTRSAGGRHVVKTPMTPDTDAGLKSEPEGAETSTSSSLPPCDTGCTESRLGLNIQPHTEIWELLKSPRLTEPVCWNLLVDGRQRGVDLLYTNMETLLPLPLTALKPSPYKPHPSAPQSQDGASEEQPPQPPPSELPPRNARLAHVAESGDCSDDGSPVKVSRAMKNSKKRQRLVERDGLNSDSDSEDGFLTLSKVQAAPQEDVNEPTPSETVKRKPLTPEERVKSVPVSQCLQSMADFLDNMSNLDSALSLRGDGDHGGSAAVGAVLKDGMTDEWRLETDGVGWMRQQHVLEIQAAVEALSFHVCRSSVADAWEKAGQLQGELGKEAAEELSLPVASHRHGYSFSTDGPSPPQLVQRRREVMETLLLRGAVALGNRSAAAVDYLPALRSICRSEQLKEMGKVKRRFLHYLDGIHLGLDKSTMQHLAEDFP